MEAERPIPQPITPESKPYWDGMKEGKLMLPKCQDCGKFHFYPRVFCPHCHSNNLTWVQGSGKGKLYSFEILYRQFNRAVKVPPPYVLAMVELEEGPRMMTNIVDCPQTPEALVLDMPLHVAFTPLDEEITLPLFRPAKGA